MSNPTGNEPLLHHAHKLSYPSHSLSHSQSQPSRIVREKRVIVISSDEDEPKKPSKSNGFRANQSLNQALTNGCRPQDQSHKPTASSSRNPPKDGTSTQNSFLHSQESRHRVDSLPKTTNHSGALSTGTGSIFENALKKVHETSRSEYLSKLGHLRFSKDAKASIPAERSTGSRELFDNTIHRAFKAQPQTNDRESCVSKGVQASRPTERSSGSRENATNSSSSTFDSRKDGEQQVSKDAQVSIPLKRSMSSREVSSSASKSLISKQRFKSREQHVSKASEAALPRELPNDSSQICVPPYNRLLPSEIACERRAVLGHERAAGSSSQNPREQRFWELYKSERAAPVQGRVFGSSTETSREHRISEVSRSETAAPSQGRIASSSRDTSREERFSEVSRSGRVSLVQERVGRSSEKARERTRSELLRSERAVAATLPLENSPGQSALRSVLPQTVPPIRHLNTTLPGSEAHGGSEQPLNISRDRSEQPADTSHGCSKQPPDTSHAHLQQPTDSSHARSEKPSDASHAQFQSLSACPLHRLVPAAPFPKLPTKEKPQSTDWSQIPPHHRPLQGPVRPDEFSDSLQKTWILENKPHLGTRHGQFIFTEEINTNQMWENPEIPSIEVNVPDEVRECMSDPKKAKEYGLDNSLAPPLEYVYTDRIVYRNNERPIPSKWHCNCHGDCRNNPHCECRAHQTEMIQRISSLIEEIDAVREFEGFAYTSTRRPPNSHTRRTHEGDQESRILQNIFIQYMLPVFECNSLCGCGPDCLNRTVGRGRREKLSLEKTLQCGWGVFAGNQINSGRLVTHYSGELISENMSLERSLAYEKIKRTYLFTLDPWWINKVFSQNLENDGFILIDENAKTKPVETIEALISSNASTRNKRVTTSLSARKKRNSDIKEKAKSDDDDICVHSVDAFWYGNISRYINHSCSANTSIVPVYIDDGDPTRPIFAMFANKLIQRGKEITTSYCNPKSESDEDSDEEAEGEMADAEGTRMVPCKCGAPNCKGRMFA